MEGYESVSGSSLGWSSKAQLTPHSASFCSWWCTWRCPVSCWLCCRIPPPACRRLPTLVPGRNAMPSHRLTPLWWRGSAGWPPSVAVPSSWPGFSEFHNCPTSCLVFTCKYASEIAHGLVLSISELAKALASDEQPGFDCNQLFCANRKS